MNKLLPLLICLPTIAFGHNLGVLGTTYPIQEPDFLQVIKKRLQDWPDLQEKWQNHVRASIMHPTAIAGLTCATKRTTRWFDPSITLHHPIKDAKGHLIAPAGAHFNPLKQVSLKTPLVFYNGEDAKQVTWVKKHLAQQPLTLILVQGRPKDQSEQMQQAVYFDQQGRLVRHFQLHTVPTLIEQVGLRLRIRSERP